MSTLPGLASKGEKAKSKFQSLDINSLYRGTLGESSEKQTQKSSLTLKHGMQSLGKVPGTRRAPANLPSLKAEHGGSDAAVSLVSSNGPGWVKQDTITSTIATTSLTTSTTNATTVTNSAPQLNAHQAAVVQPSSTAIPQSIKPHPPSAIAAAGDKSWSAVTLGNDPTFQPPPYHSPQFQHEFPSLSAGDGVQVRSGTDTQYGPGPSLRPQTEGSWMQGGSRGPSDVAPRASSVPLAAPPQLSVQVGPSFLPQYQGIMPDFMCRGNNGFPSNGHGTPPINLRPPMVPPPNNSGRNRQEQRSHRPQELEELAQRPIIKEEDLSEMDSMSNDIGWALHDYIDYNQKLEFSDDESKPEKDPKSKKDQDKPDPNMQKSDTKSWNTRNQLSQPVSKPRYEDDEISANIRLQQETLSTAISRAKQRKEEEEKKYRELTQAASAKKLQELDEKINKSKLEKESEETTGTINPALVPSPPVTTPPTLPVPKWENTEKKVEKNEEEKKSDFRQLTQIEGRSNFNKKQDKDQPSFSKSFQSDLPPRFLKQQMNSSTQPYPYDRWSTQNNAKMNSGNRKYRSDLDEKDDDFKRHDDNNYRHRSYPDSGRKSSLEDYKHEYDFMKKDEDKKDRPRDRIDHKPDVYDNISRQGTDEWHRGRIDKFERPQRPDSRDSRASRDSRHSGDSNRHSEPRDYISWSENSYEERFEEKKKEHRMPAVPGPITKEKVEADDLRSEKRNLTQLKRGLSEKKPEKREEKENDDPWGPVNDGSRAWSNINTPINENNENVEEKKEKIVEDKIEKETEDKRGVSRGKNEINTRNQGWGGGSTVHRQVWSKKPNHVRGGRGGGRSKGEWHGTESEGSADDNVSAEIANQRSPQLSKKLDRDEKNKDIRVDRAVERKSDKGREFVPRGEPSRHGRGGSSSYRPRGGGKSYGVPPTSKSPFTSADEKDKKADVDDDKAKNNKNIDKDRKGDIRRGIKKDGDASDNSDDNSKRKNNMKNNSRGASQGARGRGGNSVANRGGDKRGDRAFGGPGSARNDLPNRQNSLNDLKSNISDMNTAKNDEVNDSVDIDCGGFQEVKGKKTVKSKIDEKPHTNNAIINKPINIINKIPDKEVKKINKPVQLTTQDIPPLMSKIVNPPANMPQSKGQFDRQRQNTIPPRFAKEREKNRVRQKSHMQQGMCDMGDISNKTNSGMYGMKDGAPNISNAWEKPLRGNLDQDISNVGLDSPKNMDQSQVHCQNSSNEDTNVLDGTKPLITTIIFENTNLKPSGSRARHEKPRISKIEDGMEITNFNKPIGDHLSKVDKPETQMPMVFTKEDSADMKLDFLESDIYLTDDKATKSIGLPRTIHAITNSNNTISPSTQDALNMKIQSVKKVWDGPVMEHGSIQEENTSFSGSFGVDHNALDASPVFSKGTDTPDDNHEVYSPSSNNQNVSNCATNVCKVKPTQQAPGTVGQTVLSTGAHQSHSGMVGPLMGHPLSPPPIPPVLGGGVGLAQPPQYTPNQHLSYQASLGGSSQYGMPAIPSPPTVMYNSTQQLQAQTGLYNAFQIEQQQARSQYSQYSYNLGQAASSPYSQSMYLQAGQPHAQGAAQPPPELYPNMNNYRIPSAQFGQNQQLNNPTTVLISSTSNSLMSASVKPSNQQISAIGTKAGGVGQAYQQQSQQGQQLFMTYDPINYMQNTGVMQRGPAGPVQNSVVPGLQSSGLQPSSSYYSGSTGGQTGYFQTPGNSTLQSAQMPQHQASYGLQGNVFGTHNQSHTNAGMQNFPSPFLSTPMQLAAAINVQQYRSAAGLNNQAYMKGVNAQQLADQSGRSQQLKSPSSQQEVMSSVFNPGSQIPSPKSRQNCKQPPQQPSPTQQHKYLYQPVSNPQSLPTRYPAPIQRPVVNNYQGLNSAQNNGNKHRSTNNSNNRSSSRHYYGSQGGNMNSQNDKNEDIKINENAVNISASSNASSPNIVSKAATSVSQEKSESVKEETSAINKD